MAKKGFFVVTRIHRSDLEALGFDTSNVTDEDMKELANKMENDYLEQLYWTSMENIAGQIMKIPRSKKENEDGDDAICLELSDGTEVELRDTWRIDDGGSYDVVEIIDTNTNHVIGQYRGSIPDLGDEDYDVNELMEKVEKAIAEY